MLARITRLLPLFSRRSLLVLPADALHAGYVAIMAPTVPPAMKSVGSYGCSGRHGFYVWLRCVRNCPDRTSELYVPLQTIMVAYAVLILVMIFRPVGLFRLI